MTASINGAALAECIVHVPGVGPWWAECTFVEAPEVSGRITIDIQGLTLSGTVDPNHNGVFGLQRKCRVTGGGGGWGAPLRAKYYHNDAQIRAQTIAEDAAREAGETLGTFTPSAARIGIAYTRSAGPASRVLEDVIGSAQWWVDYDGRTQVGARSGSAVDSTAYTLLTYEPDERVAEITVDDPGAVRVGDTLDGITVRELVIEVKADTLRLRVWGGDTATGRGRLAGLLRGIVQRTVSDKIWGVWRYRVYQMSGDRVELQAVRRDAGLPDVLPIDMVPGLAGGKAELTPGTEVLVQFVEGDRRYPIATHFGGVPVELTLDASSEILLGANASNFVALSNLVSQRLDAIKTAFDTHMHIAGTMAVTVAAVAIPVTGVSGAPVSPIPPIGPVAASKVKAQ